jgi:hypothetical protein
MGAELSFLQELKRINPEIAIVKIVFDLIVKGLMVIFFEDSKLHRMTSLEK